VKFLAEYRDPELARALVEQLRRATTRPWTIMEICGGQTHSILRHGIDQVLPPGLELVHGPGCPVCVTPLETIDRAVAIAELPGTILTSFGDMLRVPGSRGSLLEARSRGADVRMVYSPLEALALARANPDHESSSWPWASRPPRPATRWPPLPPPTRACATTASWSATCWCRRRWRPSSMRPAAA
jgi:hydrogenase expression/formation protein HypD